MLFVRGMAARAGEEMGSREGFMVCLQACAVDKCCTSQCKLKPGVKCSSGQCCENCQVRHVLNYQQLRLFLRSGDVVFTVVGL